MNNPVMTNGNVTANTGLSYFSWSSKFGAKKNPFRDTLDTDLFYRTRQHEEAVVKMRIGIEDRHALILLTGGSGTGKTIVSQVALRTMDQNTIAPVFVFAYPGMSRGALLSAILKELELESVARFTDDRIAQLQEKALSLNEEGRRLVIVIDESHFLTADALHILRTLSNLETEDEKLVTVILIAEESLLRRLNAPSYASLRGRITFRFNLNELTPEETEQYIKFRLLKCNVRTNLLTDDAYQVVHHFCEGNPREINKMLYNAFLEATAADSFTITPEILRRQFRR